MALLANSLTLLSAIMPYACAPVHPTAFQANVTRTKTIPGRRGAAVFPPSSQFTAATV